MSPQPRSIEGIGINIMVSHKTHAKLMKLGKKGDAFEDIIKRLLERYK